MAATVELLVFSGMPDPTFDLSDNETSQIAPLITQGLGGAGTAVQSAETSILGYRGIRVTSDPPAFGGVDAVTVTEGTIIVLTPTGLMSFPDSGGSEQQLLAAARQRGFGDLLAQFGAPAGDA